MNGRWRIRSWLAVLAMFALSPAAFAQDWRIDRPMRIPSLEELSRPPAPRAIIPATPSDSTDPLSPFLGDSTLRRGDIVVTPDGAMQYRGDGASAHAPGDFVPAPGEAAAFPIQPRARDR